MEISKCRFCVLRVMVPGKRARFPGDTVEGFVEITSPGFNIVDLRVILEGANPVSPMSILQTFTYSDEVVYESGYTNVTVTRMAHLKRRSSAKMDCTPIWCGSVQDRDSHDSTYSLQFCFTIPHEVLHDIGSLDGSSQLPPSFGGGDELVDILSSKRYKQPLVVYAIQTSLALGPPGNIHLRRLHAMNEIKVCPCSDAQPPCAIEDFPGEFQTTSVRRIRRTLLRRLVGEMSISTREPPPIILGTSAPRASSCCMISVTFTPTNLIKMGEINLGHLRCRLKSGLRVKTYYSTQKLRQIPQRAHCSPSSAVRLRSEFVELDTRDMLMTPWKLTSQSDSLSPSPEISSEWTTSICLPINTPLDMIPTFTSTFTARLYALNLKITLLDLFHEPFELEVPLQLVYEHPANRIS